MFTNGLRVYLSGDTGQISDMQTVVKGFYGANLAVLNIGDIFTTGPEEAAFVITGSSGPRLFLRTPMRSRPRMALSIPTLEPHGLFNLCGIYRCIRLSAA